MLLTLTANRDTNWNTITSTSQPSNTFDNFLTHYWPITNGEMTDLIGNADMTQGSAKVYFVDDRFKNENSALSLNGGFTQLPSGTYFDAPEFTLSCWIYPLQLNARAPLIEFADESGVNNIFLALFSIDMAARPAFYFNNSIVLDTLANVSLTEWHFLTVTFSLDNTWSMYINSSLVASAKSDFDMPVINRTLNYIGRSVSDSAAYSNSYLDDLRIYRVSLSQQEIVDIMNATVINQVETTTLDSTNALNSTHDYEYQYPMLDANDTNNTNQSSIIVPDLVYANVDKFLTNYWPISGSQMNDMIGNASMTQGKYTSFVSDRFGTPNSALSLNGGFTQVGPAVFFNSAAFTISLWIYPWKVGSWAKIIDFANGCYSNRIYLSHQVETSGFPCATVIAGLGWSYTRATSYSVLTSQVWQFLAVTYDGFTLKLYMNGVLVTQMVLRKFVRTQSSSNFFGKSNCAGDGYSFSYLDEIKFYNVALSQPQINAEFFKSGQFQTNAVDFSAYLTNYWPIANASMFDLVGNASMHQGFNTSFTADRFGNADSALSLNGGYTQVPPGIYFDSSEFTISAWVYPSQLASWARLLDFGNGQSADNMAFSLQASTSDSPRVEILATNNLVACCPARWG